MPPYQIEPARLDFETVQQTELRLRTPRGVELVESVSRLAVTFRDVLDASILRAPVELHCRDKDRDLTARIDSDGAVDVRGRKFQSLSLAAGAARTSMIGTRPDGSFPPTNGLTFWKFADSDGKLRLIDAARTA